MKMDFMNLYRNEGLLLIGGVQDKNRVNNLQLLFYKCERTKDTQSHQADYNLVIEARDSSRTMSEYETDLN